MLQRYGRNQAGRDLAVGDIHGHFTRLESALDEAGFDPVKDRLFSVGDLVDRGSESMLALDWLRLPWFHAVCGNHEDYAIRQYLTGRLELDNYRANGGAWFIDLPQERQREFALAFEAMPFAIEVATRRGPIGILHADCPVQDWRDLPAALARQQMREQTIWSRMRIQSGDETAVRNIHAVIVGHTPVEHVTVLGNVIHIDTAGWTEQGYFTLLDLDEVRP
jgi:serine/threonine protein phosphatase 1